MYIITVNALLITESGGPCGPQNCTVRCLCMHPQTVSRPIAARLLGFWHLCMLDIILWQHCRAGSTHALRAALQDGKAFCMHALLPA